MWRKHRTETNSVLIPVSSKVSRMAVSLRSSPSEIEEVELIDQIGVDVDVGISEGQGD